MKWHEIKECHLKQVNMLSIRIKMKWHKIQGVSLEAGKHAVNQDQDEMAQNKGVPPETGKQAVSIRIKMKWHKIE